MNILVLTWRGPKHPNAGGAEISTWKHVQGWVKEGHQVTLFSSRYRYGKSEETFSGVKIIRRGAQYIGVQLSAFFWYLFEGRGEFDLVVDQFHGIPFFTPFYMNIKKLAFIHEVAKEVWFLNHLTFPFNYIFGLTGYFFEPLIFQFYRKVPFMTVSGSTKEDLINWGILKQNINVVYNGIDRIKVDMKKEKKKTVMFLGAISKDKGAEDALRVFGEIDSKEENWQYWVVGKGSQEMISSLKDRSKEMGINEKVKFLGYVSDKKKYELLAKAHVLINPSIREGWGLVNIEANSVGTPVVAYRVQGIKNSIINQKTGILVEPKKYQQLADAIIKLLANPGNYQAMQESAIAWSNNFNWKDSTEQSSKLVKAILD